MYVCFSRCFFTHRHSCLRRCQYVENRKVRKFRGRRLSCFEGTSNTYILSLFLVMWFESFTDLNKNILLIFKNSIGVWVSIRSIANFLYLIHCICLFSCQFLFKGVESIILGSKPAQEKSAATKKANNEKVITRMTHLIIFSSPVIACHQHDSSILHQ